MNSTVTPLTRLKQKLLHLLYHYIIIPFNVWDYQRVRRKLQRLTKEQRQVNRNHILNNLADSMAATVGKETI
jgi:hypothetical protein